MATAGGQRRRTVRRAVRVSDERVRGRASASSSGSVEPVTSSVRSISAGEPSISTSTSSPSATCSAPTATLTSPSARASELSIPAPRRVGTATRACPMRPTRTRIHSSLGSCDGMSTPATARTRATSDARCPQLTEQPDAEQLECERRRDRVSGDADHGRRAREAEDDGMAGTDRDALHDDLPDPAHHRDGVVATALRRAGDEQHEIGRAEGSLECLHEKVGIVRDDGQPCGDASRLLDHRREHERIRLDDLAGAGHSAERHQLVSRRQNRHDRTAPDGDRRLAHRGDDGEVGGPEPTAGGEEEVARGDVLAHLPNVGVGLDGALDRRHARCDADVLAPHDCVHAGWEWVAGVDRPVCVSGEADGSRSRGARDNGDPVHRSRIERRRRSPRDDCGRGHPPCGRGDLDRLCRESPQAAGVAKRTDPGVVRGVGVPSVQRRHRIPRRTGSRGSTRLRLRHDDAEAGGATALQHRCRARAPAARRGRASTTGSPSRSRSSCASTAPRSP